MNKREALATKGVGALILEFSIPSIVGMLANGLYNVIDRVFVGQGVGATALAGVAITFPLTLLVMGVGMLFGHGASALISIKLGEGKIEDARVTVGTATTLAFITGLCFAALVAVFMRPILTFFGGEGEVLSYAMTFTKFYLPGIVLQISSFTLNNMIRGQGDPVTALLTMLVSSGINCVLNPLFIMGLHLGIAGSAIATDCAQLASCVWLTAVYLRTKTGVRLEARNLRPRADMAKAFLSIGVAPFGMQVATVVTIILANHLVMRAGGTAAMTVMGISTSLVNLLLMPIIGLNQGVQPIIGFNFGAKQYGRVKRAIKLSFIGALVICSVSYALFFAFTPQIIGLFVRDNAEVLNLGVRGLRIFLASIPIVSVAVIGPGYFQSTRRGLVALAINLARQLFFLVPLYLILGRFFGLFGIWTAGPIADTLAVILTLAILVPSLRKLGADSPAMEPETAQSPSQAPA